MEVKIIINVDGYNWWQCTSYSKHEIYLNLDTLIKERCATLKNLPYN